MDRKDTHEALFRLYRRAQKLLGLNLDEGMEPDDFDDDFSKLMAELANAAINAYRDGLEDGAQACRYYLKHNEDRLDNTFSWEEASEYAKGFHIACEGCESAINTKIASLGDDGPGHDQ